MKKDMNNICSPMSLEEFCNILEMLKSRDKECRILAKELLRPFVYEINGNEIYLTKDFSFRYQYDQWFGWPTGLLSGPIPIWRKWQSLIENSNKE